MPLARHRAGQGGYMLPPSGRAGESARCMLPSGGLRQKSAQFQPSNNRPSPDTASIPSFPLEGRRSLSTPKSAPEHAGERYLSRSGTCWCSPTDECQWIAHPSDDEPASAGASRRNNCLTSASSGRQELPPGLSAFVPPLEKGDVLAA